MSGPSDRKAVSRPTGEARDDRVGGISEFVLPGRADLREHRDVTHFPFVGGFCPKSRALGFGVLIWEIQGRQRTGFGKAIQADVTILEAGGRPDVRLPFFQS